MTTVDDRDVDVFFSYARVDRERVKPLVDAVAARNFKVWWDDLLTIGARWRDVLEDRLDHARAVCVVWTVASVGSEFVQDEAGRANSRGVLVPILLDAVKPPLGFGAIQHVDLTHPEGREQAMKRVLDSVTRLVSGAAPVDRSQPELANGTWQVSSGVSAAHRFLGDVRVRSDMFAANPGAAQGLRDAFDGVRATYRVVLEAIDTFLAPVIDGAPITLDRYRPLADGRLVEHIGRERGHCKRIAQVYIESDGLRASLPSSVSDAAKETLDDLILMLSTADGDLFTAMASIGAALQREAAVIVNLLLADQQPEARTRLQKAEATLLPLRQDVNTVKASLEELAAELGVPS